MFVYVDYGKCGTAQDLYVQTSQYGCEVPNWLQVGDNMVYVLYI